MRGDGAAGVESARLECLVQRRLGDLAWIRGKKMGLGLVFGRV
jgi:hypothetical protein